MNSHVVSHSKCRLCDSGNIEEVIDLGYSPLANAYLTEAQLKDVRSGKLEEIFTPLRCFLCMDCGSVQLAHSVAPEVLFSDYQYASSTSPVFVKHFEDLAKHVQELGMVKAGDLVVDIGSNDGIGLVAFKSIGCNVIGVEPAAELAKLARAKEVQTIQGFLNDRVAEAIVGAVGKAKVVLATNVFAHVPDLKAFVESVLKLLDDDGVFIIEVSYLGDVIEHMLFDTIYVEHQFYHSIYPLVRFFNRLGLRVFRVERIPTHGGSIRVFVDRSRHVVDSSLPELIEGDTLRSFDTYRDLTDRIQVYKHRLHSMLNQFDGRVVAYGAPAKFATFTHVLELQEKIRPIYEDAPMKVGRFAPGSHIPILSTKQPPPLMLPPTPQPRHSVAIVTAWNFFDSIIANNPGFAKQWIRPLPKLEVVNA